MRADWASGWEFQDAARTFLRPGLRWSDGAPLTTADFVWRHEHQLMNAQLTPVVPPRQQGMRVEAPDPLTVVFRFREPYAFILEKLGTWSGTPKWRFRSGLSSKAPWPPLKRATSIGRRTSPAVINKGVHWHGNGESYWLIGEAMGHKMVNLLAP